MVFDEQRGLRERDESSASFHRIQVRAALTQAITATTEFLSPVVFVL